MTDDLTSFLASWLDWATTGAPDFQPYNRDTGLCSNAPIGQPHAQLKLLLAKEFGTATFPFGGPFEYRERTDLGTQHENPMRLDWVRKQLAKVETHRGWKISTCWYGYEATHPDYDPTPVYADDGPSDSRYVTANTRAELILAIDDYLEENEDASA